MADMADLWIKGLCSSVAAVIEYRGAAKSVDNLGVLESSSASNLQQTLRAMVCEMIFTQEECQDPVFPSGFSGHAKPGYITLHITYD